MAENKPVDPLDLFIEDLADNLKWPQEKSLLDEELPLDDPFGPRAEEKIEVKPEEKAKQAPPDNSLPVLSDERDERLKQLFEILQTTENSILAERAQGEIERIWQNSGSDTINLLLGWANAAIERQQFGKALDYLDNIIRLQPEFVEGWNRRATIYFLQKNYSLSINDVERTLALEPRHYNALAGLATMLHELGNDDEALFAFKKALAINPRMTQIKEAITELEKKVKGRGI